MCGSVCVSKFQLVCEVSRCPNNPGCVCVCVRMCVSLCVTVSSYCRFFSACMTSCKLTKVHQTHFVSVFKNNTTTDPKATSPALYLGQTR